MDAATFKQQIEPFFWTEHDSSCSLCLVVGYKDEIFLARADEGFEGSGYDWTSLADVFLHECQPELQDAIRFDPEGDMFCAYSSDAAALQKFALAFKAACDNPTLIADLFSRAQLD